MMFAIQYDSQERQFDTRDTLFIFIEEENAKAKAKQLLSLLKLYHLSNEGDILQKQELYLPFTETVDEKLTSFGHTPDGTSKKSSGVVSKVISKRKQMLSGRGKPKVTISSDTSEPLENSTKEVNQTISNKKLPNLFMLIFSGLSFIAVVMMCLTMQELSLQENKVNHMEEKLEQTVLVQEYTPSIDAFSRYFLPVYFSNDSKQLAPFLTGRLKKTLKPQDAVLKTVILERISYEADSETFKVSYVLGLEKKEDYSNTKVTFSVKKDKSSIYGFLVSDTPSQEAYLTRK